MTAATNAAHMRRAWCERCGAFCDSYVEAGLHCLADPSPWCRWCGEDLHGKGRAFCDPACAFEPRAELLEGGVAS